MSEMGYQQPAAIETRLPLFPKTAPHRSTCGSARHTRSARGRRGPPDPGIRRVQSTVAVLLAIVPFALFRNVVSRLMRGSTDHPPS
jgi:hypothetical protein